MTCQCHDTAGTTGLGAGDGPPVLPGKVTREGTVIFCDSMGRECDLGGQAWLMTCQCCVAGTTGGLGRAGAARQRVGVPTRERVNCDICVVWGVKSVIWEVKNCDLNRLCPFPHMRKCDLVCFLWKNSPNTHQLLPSARECDLAWAGLAWGWGTGQAAHTGGRRDKGSLGQRAAAKRGGRKEPPCDDWGDSERPSPSASQPQAPKSH